MKRRLAAPSLWAAVTGTTTVVVALACTTGTIGDGGSDPGARAGGGPGGAGGDTPGVTGDGIGKVGARRLTRREYDATLFDLLGDDTASGLQKLPEDVRDPFDNDYTTQIASAALVDAVEALATAASSRALAKPEIRARIVPCTPTGPSDAACFEQFVRSFGRKALRRPLAEDDVAAFVGLSSIATKANDFWAGVDVALRAMLQDPRFLYRIELGAPVSGKPGVYRLDGFEVATRLSYFLWGTTPDDALLDAAERGELDASAGVRAAAARLLDSPRARERVQRFHALWLGYEQLPHDPALTRAMKAESAALVDRVVFEAKGSWLDLFRAQETFVDGTLAAHYGLPSPGASSGWVTYGSSGRKGLLSHGSFLSVAGKFGDTSPTQRGILIRTRLLCQDIPPPPPTVNVDAPPAGDGASRCKEDRYRIHRAGGCAGCHDKMDPVGFGLERYDESGKYREVERDAPECKISGEGELIEVGGFNGPAELGDRLIASGLLEGCLVTQVHRFAMGHREGEEDRATLARLARSFAASGHRFDTLLLDLVASESFSFRREE